MISDQEGLVWLKHRLINTGERFQGTKLYMLLKKEFLRGNPEKGYEAIRESFMQTIEITKTKEFETLRSEGLIDEIAFRNIQIRGEYKRRIMNNPGKVKKRIIREELASELNMGVYALRKILFGKRLTRKKPVGRKFVDDTTITALPLTCPPQTDG
jgi:hypothetical protein